MVASVRSVFMPMVVSFTEVVYSSSCFYMKTTNTVLL